MYHREEHFPLYLFSQPCITLFWCRPSILMHSKYRCQDLLCVCNAHSILLDKKSFFKRVSDTSLFIPSVYSWCALLFRLLLIHCQPQPKISPFSSLENYIQKARAVSTCIHSYSWRHSFSANWAWKRDACACILYVYYTETCMFTHLVIRGNFTMQTLSAGLITNQRHSEWYSMGLLLYVESSLTKVSWDTDFVIFF